jgi:hypothetical protein
VFQEAVTICAKAKRNVIVFKNNVVWFWDRIVRRKMVDTKTRNWYTSNVI